MPRWRAPRWRLLIATVVSGLGLSAAAELQAERLAVFDSRELVDVLWLDVDGSGPELRVLVSGPRASAPGLYRVASDTAGRSVLTRICALDGRAHFSFDRRHLLVLSSQRGLPRLEVRDPRTCRVRLSVPARAETFDFDATHRHVAIASRSEDGTTELRLFDARGRERSVLGTDRNVELGFDPGGRVLHNFDRATAGERAYAVPTLLPRPDAALKDEETAIPGSRWRWSRADGQSRLRSPAARLHELPMAIALDRPLAMSRDARFLLTYRHDGQIGRLHKVDLARGRVIEVARGLIDSAGVNGKGDAIAWIEREGDQAGLWRNRGP